jgi:hypothetical protein
MHHSHLAKCFAITNKHMSTYQLIGETYFLNDDPNTFALFSVPLFKDPCQ